MLILGICSAKCCQWYDIMILIELYMNSPSVIYFTASQVLSLAMNSDYLLLLSTNRSTKKPSPLSVVLEFSVSLGLVWQIVQEPLTQVVTNQDLTSPQKRHNIKYQSYHIINEPNLKWTQSTLLGIWCLCFR